MKFSFVVGWLIAVVILIAGVPSVRAQQNLRTSLRQSPCRVKWKRESALWNSRTACRPRRPRHD
jgi:hypothetical protein